MPRTHRPRTTTLYLPPPAPDSGNVASSAGAAPSLEVLVMAQQIAHTRGHAFDIESFLAPEQRDEYLAYLARGKPTDHDSMETGTSSRTEPTEAAEGIETEEPEEETEYASDGGSDSGRPHKRQKTTSVSQMYWRQRLERLGLRRSSTPADRPRASTSVKPEPDESPRATPAPSAPPSKKKPLTESERRDIQASASYWNHLLVQARASRGPQWDYNTQMLLFDRQRAEYYTRGQPAPPTPPKPSESLPQVNGLANGDSDAGPSAHRASLGALQTQGMQGQRPGQRPQTPQSAGLSQTQRPPPGYPAQSPQRQRPGMPGMMMPPRMQTPQQAAQAAQASVQAQALALAGDQSHGQQQGFQFPPGMLPPGVNPMSMMSGQFQGGQIPVGLREMMMAQQAQAQAQAQAQGQGQGPMLAGWGGENSFNS